MLCRFPFMVGSLPCPCGGCLPCRINRRRIWAHRILLESYKHGDNCFVTLTYDKAHLPADGSLQKSHYQLFLKRLRRVLSPAKIRYFLAGEYGEASGRPHYHLAIFGLDAALAGGVDGRSGLVKDCWPHGFTFVGSLTWESAQYIAGYLTKKAKVDENSIRSFNRMSLRPGIGHAAISDVCKSLSTDFGLDSVALSGDVPSALQHGRRLLPFGRYLRRVMRGQLGFASKDTPKDAVRLYVLRQADEAAEAKGVLRGQGFKPWEIEKMMLDVRNQKINNLEARFKNRDQKRRLS